MKLAPVTLENAFVRLDPLEERHREPLREAGADPAEHLLRAMARTCDDGQPRGYLILRR